MKKLATAAALILSASALYAAEFDIKVSDVKNLPVPAPRLEAEGTTFARAGLAPVFTAVPAGGSWNAVDVSVQQFFVSWKQGKPVNGLMQIQTNASCAKPVGPRHDIVVTIPTSGLTVTFPSSGGFPLVQSGNNQETVEIPGGLVVTIPGNPPIDLSNNGPEIVVSIPGGPAAGGLVVSIPGNTMPTVTFPPATVTKNPRLKVLCGINPVNPFPHN